MLDNSQFKSLLFQGKLELLTGGSVGSMKVTVLDKENQLVCHLDNDDALLGSYPIDSGMIIYVRWTYNMICVGVSVCVHIMISVYEVIQLSTAKISVFLKNASLLVCKTLFLHSLTVECMRVCRRSCADMFTDVLYTVNMYVLFLCKAFWAKSCYGHCAIEMLCIIIMSDLTCIRWTIDTCHITDTCYC